MSRCAMSFTIQLIPDPRFLIPTSNPPSRRGSLSRRKIACELLDRLRQRRFYRIVELFFLGDRAKQLRVPRFDETVKLGLERTDVGDWDVVQIAVRAGEDNR